MKRVSFEVAKAIKEVGYPQDYRTDIYYSNESEDASGYGYQEGDEISYDAVRKNQIEAIAAPTYLEVWLWLCDKGIVFYPAMYSAHNPSGWSCYYRDNIRIIDLDTFGVYNNPEEAIIAAIEYLVTNNLIK